MFGAGGYGLAVTPDVLVPSPPPQEPRHDQTVTDQEIHDNSDMGLVDPGYKPIVTILYCLISML